MAHDGAKPRKIQIPRPQRLLFNPYLSLAVLKRKESLRVLHVDDDQGVLEVSKQILTMENNFEIESASSVDEAFQKLERQNYDAIISDYEMPLKNGLDFLKELRQQQKDIPFILFTGKGREEVVVKALNLGADSYINKNGSPETVYCELANAINKTVKHKKAERNVLEQKIRAEQYLNVVGSIILALDVQGKITLLNKKGYDILGYEEGELNGKDWIDTCHPTEIRQELRKLFDDWVQGKAKPPEHYENEVVTKYGEKRLVSWHDTVLRDENGQLVGTLSSGEDITEQKNSEEALLAAGEKFRTIFENVHDVITYVDTHGKILDVNNRIEDLLGYKREEIIGKNFVKLGLIKFLDVPKLLKLFVGSIRKGEETKIIVLELKHKNGSRVSVEVGTRFIRDKKGKIVNIVNIFRDVTENKKAEAALVESEEKFRKVFAIGHDAFLISDLKESTIIEANERFGEMFGYNRQEVIGKSAIQLGIWANLPDREKIAQNLKSKGKIENLEIFCRKKSGESFPILLSVSLLQANNQQLVLSTVRDLSSSKNAENALKESEEKFRNLAEESPNIIFINKQGRVVYANKKSEEITGYTREELYSPNFNFLSLSPPEYDELVKSAYSKHLKGEYVPPYHYELISKDGKRIDAVITSKMIEYEGEKAILGIVTDISELKKAEEALNQTMDELVSVNEKLGVVGNLTRHDVRNKLSVITGNIYLLKKKHSDNPEIINRLREMEEACKNITKIFDFAKMYEQIGVGELSLTDVKKTIDEAAALFSASPNVKIINDCHGLTVLADSFLRQLYYNLIDNSIKHGKRVTKIRVHYEKTSQDQLNLIYEDDGVGIPDQNKPELFREGFSTGGSSGYGLYLIKKMMETYGWTIRENGEPEIGAKFTITIPKLKKGKENYQIAK